MLGKLLKHEFWATARILLPINAVVLALGALTGAMGLLNLSEESLAMLFPFFSVLGYIMAVCAAIIVTFVVIVLRFYRNFLTPEGYLMFTLPVTRHQLILSKLIAAFAWQLVSWVVAAVSALIVAAGWGAFDFLSENMWYIRALLPSILEAAGLDGSLWITMLFLSLPIGAVSGTLMMYVSMAIGQLANNSRVALSFAAYIGIYTAVQIITSLAALLLVFVMGTSAGWTEAFLLDITTPSLIMGNVISAITCGIYYFGTVQLLSKRLNLV
ncbi:MAG: hypothetical protein FWF11_03575 [Coriobacteriia bacterium]|nr:hypothetical protein [Coriobacteriia bacterium]